MIALLALFIAFCLLCILAVIDFRTRLLPNIYVYPYALLAVMFHAVTNFSTATPAHVLLGALCGGGLLYGIRLIANTIYKTDTLGLGDVKLMGAAGLWLGVDYIFLALCVGAFAGVLHGLLYIVLVKIKTGKLLKLDTLSIPAGPGFIVGIILVGFLKFQDLPHTLYL